MEKNFLMKVVQVRLYCDDCEVEMEHSETTSGAYMTLNYHYVCPKCGKKHSTTTQYPKVDFVPTNTPVITKLN